MTPTLIGAPLTLYSFPCFLLAFIWTMVWPRKAAPPGGPGRFILRWGHSVVWFLLGIATLVEPQTGSILAVAATALYVVFVATLLRYTRRVPQ